jgi:hypothetical protein
MHWFCQGNGWEPATGGSTRDAKGLVIFLPGTYLQPQDYSDIVAEFSLQGYLSIGLCVSCCLCQRVRYIYVCG